VEEHAEKDTAAGSDVHPAEEDAHHHQRDQERQEGERALRLARDEEQWQVPEGDDDAHGEARQERTESAQQRGKRNATPAEFLERPRQQPGDHCSDPHLDGQVERREFTGRNELRGERQGVRDDWQQHHDRVPANPHAPTATRM
jgi:hypothetical protein